MGSVVIETFINCFPEIIFLHSSPRTWARSSVQTYQDTLQRNIASSFVLHLYYHYSAFDSQPWRNQCVILNRGYLVAVSREEIGTEESRNFRHRYSSQGTGQYLFQ